MGDLVQFPVINDPGTFVYDAENPTKYTEACSHAIHSVLYAMYQGGYVLSSEDTPITKIHIDRYREFDSVQVIPGVSTVIEEEGGV